MEFASLPALFSAEPAVFWVFSGLLGLIVGSFLNVVIYRVPLMLEREWHSQCADLLEREDLMPLGPAVNLFSPRSRCPHCAHPIGALENIPVLSYLWQRGRCRHCALPISPRYPVIELGSGLIAVVVAVHYGFSPQWLGALLLSWALLSLSVIDFDRQWLPDMITLPWLWLGLAFNLFGVYAGLHEAVLGAMLGYLSLWSVYQGYRLYTYWHAGEAKEGMGFGDFKLFALLGAWLGWKSLLLVLLLSSFAAAVVGLSLILLRRHDKNTPLPFGPYLALAGWVALLWGDPIMRAYLAWGVGVS